MFYDPSMVKKKDGAEARAQRMRWLLNFIREHPEGTPQKRLTAITSLNLGLSPEKIEEYLDQFISLNLVEIRLGTIYPLTEEVKEEKNVEKKGDSCITLI
ncbi:MAG: hypothetical protein ABSB40_02555 [Nitrososphaeria archaeon]